MKSITHLGSGHDMHLLDSESFQTLEKLDEPSNSEVKHIRKMSRGYTAQISTLVNIQYSQ